MYCAGETVFPGKGNSCIWGIEFFVGGGGDTYAEAQASRLALCQPSRTDRAGPQGTGKTVTLQILAEGFSAMGVGRCSCLT